MQDAAYQNWLREQGYADSTVSTQLSALRRIEASEQIDLDLAWETDGLSTLRERYRYSRADEAAGRPNLTKLSIDPDNQYGFLAFYRYALK